MNGNRFKKPTEIQTGRPPIPLPDHIIEYLTSIEQLEEMKFLSINDRCKLVMKNFGFFMSRKRLIGLYRRKNINYRRSKYCYKNTSDDVPWRLELRIECAMRIATLLQENTPIIFIDETSTSLW